MDAGFQIYNSVAKSAKALSLRMSMLSLHAMQDQLTPEHWDPATVNGTDRPYLCRNTADVTKAAKVRQVAVSAKASVAGTA